MRRRSLIARPGPSLVTWNHQGLPVRLPSRAYRAVLRRVPFGTPAPGRSLAFHPTKERRVELLAAMRENHGSFENVSGACALWSNRDQVQALLRQAQDARPAGLAPTAKARLPVIAG